MDNSSAQWDEAFEKAVRSYLFDLSAAQPLTPDMNLWEFGLDSCSTYGLLGAIEKLYDLKFPPGLHTFETFETPAMLWASVQEVKALRELI